MRESACPVIFGGGIGGLPALNHPTLECCTEAVLVELDKLTSGTTQHSASGCPNLVFNPYLHLPKRRSDVKCLDINDKQEASLC